MKKILWVLAMFFAFTGMAFAAINLNTATKEELDSVNGIGPVKAQEIINYRTEHGPFTSVNDLKNVKGFSDKNVAKMRSELSVSGASTMKKEDKPGKADNKMAKEDKKGGKAAEKMSEKPAKADKQETKADEMKDAKADKKAAKKAAKKAKKKADKEAAQAGKQ